jgi:hypothetical protein
MDRKDRLHLDVSQRARLVADLLTHLRDAIPGGQVRLRGSLAAEGADPYSDIDLLWDVPDTGFSAALAVLPVTLARVRPVASLRFDPDFQRSANRRLAFVRFAGVSLFWRVDLDIVARSVADDPDYDRHNPAARGTDWSAPESSLANAIAAVKAHLRGRDDEAARLLERAEHRTGMVSPPLSLPERILRLVDAAAQREPSLASLATEIRSLVAGSF